jgi:hypothetical protein
MNRIFTTVKKPQTIDRPVSLAACVVFVGTSIFVSHEGLMAWLPEKLGLALTALFIATAVLQWLALGRREACLQERDNDRADAVVAQAWMFGAIETALFAAGALAIAAEEGADAYRVEWIVAAVAGAAVFAFANFRVKWVSVDPVTKRQARPTLPAVAAPEPVDAAYTSDDGVINFERRLRLTHRHDGADATHLAAGGERLTDDAVFRTRKRLQKRVERQRAA